MSTLSTKAEIVVMGKLVEDVLERYFPITSAEAVLYTKEDGTEVTIEEIVKGIIENSVTKDEMESAIKKAIADLIGIDDPEEKFKTLKDLIDWINNHEDFAKGLTEDLEKKVDKEDGKGLSTNDFTDQHKQKLEGLSNYDDTAIKQTINTHIEDTDKHLTAEEKEKILGIGRIIVSKDVPEDLTENDLLLQKI